MEEEWYIVYNGKQVGPMTVNQLSAYNLNPESLVWKKGMQEWKPLYNFPQLMEALSKQSSMNNHAYTSGFGDGASNPMFCSDRNHVTAGLLALFLGGLGIQYFYIGKTTAGFLTILLSFVTCGVWGLVILIQAIMMLTMSQHEFDRKFVYTQSSFPLF